MKKLINNTIFQLVIISLLGVFSVLFGKSKLPVSSKNIISQQPVIIVDAGHGGFDGGAVAFDGTAEKDINLSIAKKLEQLLIVNGCNVIMTRNGDVAINDYGTKIATKKKSDMQNRLLIMEENPDAVFVSIHLNKYTTSAPSGAQIFYSPNYEKSKILAENIMKSIVSLLQKDNTRELKKGTKSTYLLYNAKVPAVIVECGFLSNKNDLDLLKSEEYQSKIAFCIFNGIVNFKNSY